MNVNRTMLKPYTSICKDIPVYRTICRHIDRVCTGAVLHRGAQLRFVPRDSHPDKIVIVAPWTPCEAVPRRFLDDELDGLESAVPGFVVEVAHADEALAVTRKQLLRPRHAGAQRQSGFHPGSLSALNARAGEPCTIRQESNFLNRTGASATSMTSMRAAKGAPRAMFPRGRTTQISMRIQGGRAR